MGTTNFPTSLDDWADEGDGDTIEEDNINNVQRALEEVEAKVGIDSSAVATSHDYLLTHLPSQSQNWDAGGIEVRAQTFESDVVTGTIPVVVASTTKCTYLNADQVDGKDVDGSNGAGEITTNDGTQTLTNKTLTSPTIGTSIALPADSVDAITEIKSTIKSGADATLVTGTKGTTNYTAKWDANGDLIDGYEVLDEDAMGSDSATKLSTQQSIKAYVDASIGNYDGTSVFDSTSPTSYTDLNLSAQVGAIRAMVFLYVVTTGGNIDVQFRTNGTTEDQGFSSASYFGGGSACATIANGRGAYIVLPTDSSGVIEWKAGSALAMTINLIGYLKLS